MKVISPEGGTTWEIWEDGKFIEEAAPDEGDDQKAEGNEDQ